MPSQYCFLCASDEGVFLDITADNKQIYHEQFEICSLVKVPTTDQLPTKICHKCVYELNQCTSFLQKYNRSAKQKVSARKNHCSLCSRITKKEYIFDLSKDKNLQHSSLDKIRKVFKNDLGKFQKSHQFICLTCRYTVDLLLDLKNVSQEIATKLNDIINEEIDYLNFPKIKTTVVNRKTTTTESTRIAIAAQDAEESDKMTRTRSQDNRLTNNKSSEKPTPTCSNIKADSNAYKIQKTDEIVCKGFWTSIKSTDVDKQQNVAETKSCKVFLKDVLKVTALKEQKLHQAEEKDQQKKASAVTEKPSTVESKSRRAATEAENETGRQTQKRPARSGKIDSTDVKELPAKRLRSSAKQVTPDLKESVSETSPQKLKPPEQEDAARKSGQSYTSDSTATSNRTLTRHKRTTGASLSDADVDSRRERKKLKAILAGNTAIKNMDINGVSSNEEAPPRRKRLRFTSTSPVTIDLTKSDKGEESDNKHAAARKGKVRTRRLRKPFRASKTARKAKSSESDNKESADEEAKLYVCKECGANYENKLVGLTHQLTHYKQPKLALEKRVIDNVEKETEDASEAVDDQCEDQTETIAIIVDDDEEETAGDVSNLDERDRLAVSADAEEKAPSPEKEGKERMEKEEVKETVEAKQVKETIEAEEVKETIEADEVNETIEAEAVKETIEAEEVKETEEKEEEKETETTEKEAIQAKDTQETMDMKEVDTKETKDTKENAADVELIVKESTDDEPDQAEEPKEKKESGSVEILATPSPSRGRKRGARRSGARWSRGRKSSTSRSRSRSNVNDKSGTENVSEAKVEESTSTEQAKDVSRTQIEDITEEVKTEEQAEEVQEGSSMTIEEPEEDKKVDKEEETPKESRDKEKEEKAVCTEQDSEPVDKENMNGLKLSADVDEVVALVDEETPEPKEDEQNGVEEKDAQSEIETRPEDSNDKAKDTEKEKSPKRTKSIEFCEENKENEEEQSVQANGDAPVTSSEAPLEGADVLKDSEAPGEKDAEKAEEGAPESETPKPEKPTSESANVAAEILQEVLELASVEVQNQQDVIDADTNNDSVDTETLENISREIQNCVDMPSLQIDSVNIGNDSE